MRLGRDTLCRSLTELLETQHLVCRSPAVFNFKHIQTLACDHALSPSRVQGDHAIVPGPLAPPLNFNTVETESQTVNYAALPNPTTLPDPLTICPDGASRYAARGIETIGPS